MGKCVVCSNQWDVQGYLVQIRLSTGIAGQVYLVQGYVVQIRVSTGIACYLTTICIENFMGYAVLQSVHLYCLNIC